MTTYRVPGLENPHTHFREVFPEGDIVTPLIRLAIQGGARTFGPMPNTTHGLMNAEAVVAYIRHAKEAVPAGTAVHFVPIVQITEATTNADIDACVGLGIMDAKIYPKGRTTESHNGVQHYVRILDVVNYAGACGMRVHFHPEHPSELVDNRDGEFLFLPIMDIFMHETDTTLVWEHATDARCIPHWEEWGKTGRFYLTITAHHLAANETGTYGDVGALCKPSYKTEADRRGLIGLIAKDHPWVMAGGDDAPHPTTSKHRLGPCACGAYTAPFLLQLYAHALCPYAVTLEMFINFTSANARRLYGEHVPQEYFLLKSEPFQIPKVYKVGYWDVEPFWAGRTLNFSLEKAQT
jgi:dihydroorotase